MDLIYGERKRNPTGIRKGNKTKNHRQSLLQQIGNT